ncbi:hypothetical protein GYB22_05380 [bacterium]|nr:hypothetical protein [bacterium]
MSKNNPIDDLREIRSIMESSSRFMSLSGMSGVMAGIYALVGAWFATNHYQKLIDMHDYWPAFSQKPMFYSGFFGIAAAVVALSLITGIALTARRAKRDNKSIWDKVAKRMLINLFIPLATGGVFCLSLMYHGNEAFIYSAMLMFYGLSLINASKYTLKDIYGLGLIEIALGLYSAIDLSSGLMNWIIGFGVMHIVYGIYMYIRYERN